VIIKVIKRKIKDSGLINKNEEGSKQKKQFHDLSKENVLEFVKKSSSLPTKRDIAKGLGLRSVGARRRLKDILRELTAEGLYVRKAPARFIKENVADAKQSLASISNQILGNLYATDRGIRFIPMQRKINIAFLLDNEEFFDPAAVGSVVQATIVSEDPPIVHIDHEVGQTTDVSLLVSHMASLPMEFSAEAMDIAEKGAVPPLGNREDLRTTSLVTIDGKDSRDFDDAVWAAPDTDPKNPGGWHIIVAIADVAHYVRPGSVLDKEAYERGTSVYFPDRVIPMLPAVLSNGLCSLNPHEDRACVAVHIWIDAEGQKKKEKFVQALMRSSARMTYEEVQTIHESQDHPRQDIVSPLYGAFRALEKGRITRGTLEIEGVEPYIIFDDKGFVKDLIHRERLDSHRLIEEFMILANVAAAETLEKAKMPCMYRIHDVPDLEKIEEVRRLLSHLKINYRGPLKTPQDLTALLMSVKGTPHQSIVNELVLRSQSQAVYSPNNIGHFGLNLEHYAHFTSPIRRYADVLIHRSLLAVLGYKEDGLPEGDGRNFEDYGAHISMAERRAQGAEREAMDRYMTHYLQGRVGEIFEVYVTGITKAGLFVNIAHLGASGLVPMRLMGDDYYVYKEYPTRLEGRRTRRVFSFGDPMRVKLLEADTTKGRLTFEPLLDRVQDRAKSLKEDKPFKKHAKKADFSRKKR